MQYVTQCVEQLDRAVDELQEGSVVANRLALILTDNIVELMLHRRCQDIFARMRTPWSKAEDISRYSKVERHRVLGRYFHPKLKFLVAEREISPTDYDFIRICHDLRNAAYHSGVTDDSIWPSLAWEYHALACELFGRFRISSWRSKPGAPLSSRLAKHLGQKTSAAWRPFAPDQQGDIAASLNRTRPALMESLPTALASHAEQRIKRLEDLLEYLVKGNPGGHDLQKTLDEAQWWHDLFAEIPDEIEENSGAYRELIRQRGSAMRASWRPKHRTVPIDAWRRRAEQLRDGPNALALLRHQQLMNDMAYIYDAVEEAAGALDAHVEEQIERMRTERGL
jgi:hypothetical protein